MVPVNDRSIVHDTADKPAVSATVSVTDTSMDVSRKSECSRTISECGSIGVRVTVIAPIHGVIEDNVEHK